MIRNILSNIKHWNGNHFQVISMRHVSIKKVPKVDKKLQAAAESLAARGFLRPTKHYDPPEDIEEKILQIVADNGMETKLDAGFDGLDKKFVVLNACFSTTGHGVPNSLLHTIYSVGDLLDFYKTPVDTNTPFDTLKKMDLPKNLYVQQDYVRFHPDKDTLFGGKSSYPKSSTIVTGLKSRKKYEGYSAKRSWP